MIPLLWVGIRPGWRAAVGRTFRALGECSVLNGRNRSGGKCRPVSGVKFSGANLGTVRMALKGCAGRLSRSHSEHGGEMLVGCSVVGTGRGFSAISPTPGGRPPNGSKHRLRLSCARAGLRSTTPPRHASSSGIAGRTSSPPPTILRVPAFGERSGNTRLDSEGQRGAWGFGFQSSWQQLAG